MCLAPEALMRSDEAVAVVGARPERTTPPPLLAPRTSGRSVKRGSLQSAGYSNVELQYRFEGRTAPLGASLGIVEAMSIQWFRE